MCLLLLIRFLILEIVDSSVIRARDIVVVRCTYERRTVVDRRCPDCLHLASVAVQG